MKIQILSDLHFEFYPKDTWRNFLLHLQPKEVDVLVLAGDICSNSMIEKVLTEFSSLYKNVVYVPGNHEFYKADFQQLQNKLDSLKIPNVHILNGSKAEIDGQSFIGGTLWFRDAIDHFKYNHYMTDFAVIRNFTPNVFHCNERHEQYLKDYTDSNSIVVTHHLPTNLSVHSKYKDNVLNRFFVTDLTKLIEEKQPKLVIHGHTHESFDYKIGNTRVLCNPFGYLDYELNEKFSHKCIVEI